jgi:DNA repair protein RecN (Recombination protein N)
MGLILKKMSKKHQIISITHSPQIAAKADYHYFVFKNSDKVKTYTNIVLLDKESQILEMAKMLSGDPPTEGAIKNAKELIEQE